MTTTITLNMTPTLTPQHPASFSTTHFGRASMVSPKFESEDELPFAFWFAETPCDYLIATEGGGQATDLEWMSLRCGAGDCVDKAYIQEADTEISRRVRDLMAQNVQLQEKNRVCAAYIADIAHELRNSLLTLNFYVELLAKGDSRRHPHYQQMAVQSVDRLRHFVEDTLSLSRLEFAGALRGEMAQVDLNALIRTVILQHQAQAEVAGLDLRFDAAVGLPAVQGDVQLLSQVIINLVTNAMKYTRRGWIHVKTTMLPATREVVVEVADSGIGIAAEDLPYLFERFYRARDEQIDTIPGTGLGLAIVKEIVQLHQGKLEVDSTPGAGSCFRVRLPELGAKA